MSAPRVGLIALLAATVLTLCRPALAESLPDLTDAQRQTLANGIEHKASYGDPAFDALLEHTRSWGRLMARWAANPALAPAPLLPTDVDALGEGTKGSTGDPAVIFGQLLEREPVAKYANVERWLVAPLDPENRTIQPDRAAIIFVDRTVSEAINIAQPGWFVSVACRFYKPLLLPRRTTGEEVPYASLVGASYGARQDRGGPNSSLFAYIGLGVAVFIAAVIIIVVLVMRVKAEPRSRFDVPRPVEPPPEETGLPADPAEALKHLADRADSADKEPNA